MQCVSLETPGSQDLIDRLKRHCGLYSRGNSCQKVLRLILEDNGQCHHRGQCDNKEISTFYSLCMHVKPNSSHMLTFLSLAFSTLATSWEHFV